MRINNEKVIRNSFAVRVFRDTADYDYIAARTLFQNELFDQFLFYAQQSIEKYLKGILLFNDIRAVNLHGLDGLLKKCNYEFLDETKEFIKNINGSEHSRYLTYGVSGRREFLLKLDRSIFDIRRYCQGDSDYVKIYSTKTLQELKKYNKRIIFAGRLENILENKNKKFNKLRSNLIWKNFYYGKNTKREIKFSFGWWGKSSSIDFNNKEEYEALSEFVYMPKNIHNHFKEKEFLK